MNQANVQDTPKKKKFKIDCKPIVPNTLKKFDIMLTLITNVTNKKQDGEKCICSYDPISHNVHYENEIVPDIEVNHNTEGKIKLSEVIIKLKQFGYPLTGSMISVFSKVANSFVSCGADPLDKIIILDDNEHIDFGIIKIRCTCFIDHKHLVDETLLDISLQNSPSSAISPPQSCSNDKKSKRTKERKIGYIIEKVNLWRRLYNGFYNEEGVFIKNSLDEAAKLIKISKKSLDDYLLQLRLGRKYGFNFNGNKQSKVGVLRSFVKNNRIKNDNQKNDTDDDL